MAYVVHSSALAFQRTKKDDPSMPDGPEEIVKQGDRVPDYVGPFHLAALASAGMISVVSDDPVPAEVGPVGPEPPVKQDDLESVAPKPTDSRATWEDYAVSKGMTPEQAASFANKGDLIEAVTTL
jgi:hypothetical protein